jgi:hypothetical protein
MCGCLYRIYRIRGNNELGIEKMSQDDIRRMREFNCCLKCIDSVIDKGEVCFRCEAQKKLMKKSYSTEMFEELVEGRKIVVFCSMINRIKYRIGNIESSKYIERLGNELSVEEMEEMCVKQMKLHLWNILSHIEILGCGKKRKRNLNYKILI